MTINGTHLPCPVNFRYPCPEHTACQPPVPILTQLVVIQEAGVTTIFADRRKADRRISEDRRK